MSDVRIDKWLWAVRIYKTRSDAAEACRTNKVTINGSHCKPSREVKEGDVVGVRKVPYMTYTWRVLGLIDKRQGAQNVAMFAENITPESELEKLSAPRETIFIQRDRGTGRPTKKERREMDNLMDTFYFGEEEL
ncbi:MAG: RNA-binding S4 domain-containing protein [Tidjanibacter sp.]|nr:RNA-binding S4 domain-containing protein [Tidjanibacter sp.]